MPDMPTAGSQISLDQRWSLDQQQVTVKMQILRAHLRPTQLEMLGGGSEVCFHKPFSWSDFAKNWKPLL